jgi:hypothetical protein
MDDIVGARIWCATGCSPTTWSRSAACCRPSSNPQPEPATPEHIPCHGPDHPSIGTRPAAGRSPGLQLSVILQGEVVSQPAPLGDLR